MDLRDFATALAGALEDFAQVDNVPILKKGFADISCEDDEGNEYMIRVTRVSAASDDEDDDEDGISIESVEDLDL